MNLDKNSKTKKLLIGIFFDLLGYVSYVFPPFDFIWAPLSAYIMTKLYPGRAGKVAAVGSFIEEALPMIDFIPSFTIMWLYTFVFSSSKTKQVVEIEK
ncbi:hypothetical protein [Xanthomarina spongicola]|uniref:Uncharacterized protein n=1 Tax=Xanthomarina spongicola TaxID=570520 RepID=A0A316DP54_9FLAO|nr:hypothetical protein [Xanthomarina spongicola]PWK19804.1 hypothetical protein LX78_01154 [Xanthomarina spongicola]